MNHTLQQGMAPYPLRVDTASFTWLCCPRVKIRRKLGEQLPPTLNVIRAGRTKLGYERYLKHLYNRSTPMEIAPCGQGGSEVSVV